MTGEVSVGEISGWGNSCWGSCDWGNGVVEVALGKWPNTFFFSLPVIYNVVYYSPDTQDILQISSLRLNIPR